MKLNSTEAAVTPIPACRKDRIDNRSKLPSRIRLTIVMIGFVYPLVTSLLYGLGSVTDGWEIWHRTLILTPITVASIVFGISPFVARYFGWFVRP